MEANHLYAFQLCRRIRESSTFLLFTNPGKPIAISHYFWGLKKPDETILIDVGFPWEALQKKGEEVKDFLSPEKLLANIGVDPGEIKRVILTHLHWDHVSAIDLFKNATYFLQKREFEFFTGPLVQHPIVKRSVDIEDMMKLLRLNYEGRLVLLDGDCQIEDGVDLFLMGGHTPGTQGVKISGSGREILITGDNTPFYRNLMEGIPPGIYSNLQEVLWGYQKVKKMMKSLNDILPGHDPEVAVRFPFDRGVITVF